MNVFSHADGPEPLDPQDPAGLTTQRRRGPQAFARDAVPGPAPANRDGEGEPGFWKALRLAWDNKFLLATCVLLFAGFAAWSALSQTRLYTATASIVLEAQRQTNPIVSFDSVVPELTTDYQAMNTELLFLRSPALMARVVEVMDLTRHAEFNPTLGKAPDWPSLGLVIGDPVGTLRRIGGTFGWGPAPAPAAAPPDPEAELDTATEILTNKVRVSVVPTTYAFEISVVSKSPQRAADIANTIVAEYIQRQREAKFDAMKDATAWLSTRVLELKEELEAKEAAVKDFSAQASAVNEEMLLANTRRLKGMRDRLAQQRVRAGEIRSLLDAIETRREASDFVELASLLGAAGAAELQEAALGLAGVGSGGEAEGESGGEAEGEPGTDDALAGFDARLDAFRRRLGAELEQAEAQAGAFEDPVRELEETVADQSADLVTLRQLAREAESTRLIYEYFLNRMKEISVQEGTQQADARLLSAARPPDFSSYPKVRETTFRAGIFGLASGLALIFLRDSLRTRIRAPEDLAEIADLKVLGIIPEAPRRRSGNPLAEIVDKPMSALAESVRNLRTAIQLSDLDLPPRVVMLTSSVPDEGKSVLSAALARTSAMGRKKVLLIDADLRRRGLIEHLGIEPRYGLVSLLSERCSLEDALQHEKSTGLDVIVGDRSTITPADVFESARFRDFLDEMRERYDLIVIDTPPVLAVPDARVLARLADAVIYVVRWNSTRRRMIRSGLDLFRQINVPVTGLALTRIDPRRMDRYGYYGYGYGQGSRGLQKYYAR